MDRAAATLVAAWCAASEVGASWAPAALTLDFLGVPVARLTHLGIAAKISRTAPSAIDQGLPDPLLGKGTAK